jgi:hypothetical protein
MDQVELQEQIGRILRSASFAGKKQLKMLLEILSSDLQSQATLKPDRIIQRLWPEEARSKTSADLATERTRLRKALERYYSSEGQFDSITISLPSRVVSGQDGTKERRWIAAEFRIPVESPHCPPDETDMVNPADPPPLSPIPPVPSPALKRLHWMGIMAGIILIGLILYFVHQNSTADRRPASGRLENKTLVILNAEGQVLWRKNFPAGFWYDYYHPGFQNLYTQDGVEPHLWFGDLDGDGHTDVLFTYQQDTDRKSHSTTLICYTDRGKEKWRWTPGRDLPELSGSPAVYLTMGFGVLEAAPGHPRRIVVMSRHEFYYPTQIALLDAHGKTLSEYWHSGHLFHFALASHKGREQIIALGINNGYHQATLIVLDPDRLAGASSEIARPEVQIHGMGVAHESLRLLFARSDLNRDTAMYNEGMELVIDANSIQIEVKECWLTAPSGCTILYAFDRNFNLLSDGMDDTFLNAHREYYAKNKIDHPFSKDEEAQFQKVRCLEGCATEFVPVLTPAGKPE